MRNGVRWAEPSTPAGEMASPANISPHDMDAVRAVGGVFREPRRSAGIAVAYLVYDSRLETGTIVGPLDLENLSQ